MATSKATVLALCICWVGVVMSAAFRGLPPQFSATITVLDPSVHQDNWMIHKVWVDGVANKGRLDEQHGATMFHIYMDFNTGLQWWEMSVFGRNFCWELPEEGNLTMNLNPFLGVDARYSFVKTTTLREIEADVFVNSANNDTLYSGHNWPHYPLRTVTSGVIMDFYEVVALPPAPSVFDLPDVQCFKYGFQPSQVSNLLKNLRPSKPKAEESIPALSMDLVNAINQNGGTWTASMNDYFRGKTIQDAINMMGVTVPSVLAGTSLLTNKKRSMERVKALPENFDARQQWKGCIHPIRNQGGCGSCWAHGSSEAASDRLCIESNGKVNVVLSPQDMVSCDFYDWGCMGGSFDMPWVHITQRGLASVECFPYVSGDGLVPKCSDTCNGTNKQPTRYTAQTAYSVGPDPSQIQLEIYEHGPVSAAYLVFQDFIQYKSGVYQYTNGTLLGGHMIKLIGWGVEAGVPYWLAANSWGPDWGEEGFFKIRRGTNECGIESAVSAAVGFI